jgi:hypothetical protein
VNYSGVGSCVLILTLLGRVSSSAYMYVVGGTGRGGLGRVDIIDIKVECLVNLRRCLEKFGFVFGS